MGHVNIYLQSHNWIRTVHSIVCSLSHIYRVSHVPFLCHVTAGATLNKYYVAIDGTMMFLCNITQEEEVVD